MAVKKVWIHCWPGAAGVLWVFYLLFAGVSSAFSRGFVGTPGPPPEISPFLQLILEIFGRPAEIRPNMVLIFTISLEISGFHENKARFWPYFLKNPAFRRNKYHFWTYYCGLAAQPTQHCCRTIAAPS